VVLWGARSETTKMPKKGHSEEKIPPALHQAKGGEKVADIRHTAYFFFQT